MPNDPPLPQDPICPLATAPVPPLAGAQPPDARLPRWSTRELMGDAREAEIMHSGSTYRLRITSLGRLILTK